MTTDWRSRPRRKIRSAPLNRPPVEPSSGLAEEVASIVGEAASQVLSLFKGKLPGSPAEFHELEQKLLKIAREDVAGRVLVAIVEDVHRNEDFVVWSLAQARRLTPGLVARSRQRPIRVRVPGAEGKLKSPYMEPSRPKGKPGLPRKPGRRGKGGKGLYPVLAALGFVRRCSPYLASQAARNAAQLDSFEAATDVLASTTLKLDPDTVRNMTMAVADAGLKDRESEEPLGSCLKGKRVVICADGGRLRCREEKPGRRLPSGFHGYHTPWFEPKVLAAYAVGTDGKQLKGCKAIYEGTVAPWKDAVELFARTLRRHGVQDAAQVAIAADGSNNIWNEVDRFIELTGLDRNKIVFFLDFYHAVEHLWSAARLSSTFETDQGRQHWVTEQTNRLKAGQFELVIRDLENLSASDDQSANALVNECRYFGSRTELLHYDKIQAMGFPIGTGAVESAIRRVVNLRLKGPSVFWTKENAERMLYLRCRLKAGRWQEVERAMHQGALIPYSYLRADILNQVA